MNIVKAGYHFITPKSTSPEDTIAHIERCGRVCYKSEDRITPVSGEKFVKNITKRGHTSVLEHGNIIMSMDGSSYMNIKVNASRLIDDGRRVYLRFTNIENRYIVSGNIRAWRDFFNLCRSYGLSFYATTINEFRNFCVLFSDVISNEMGNGAVTNKYINHCSVAGFDSLASYIEKFVHCTLTIKFTVDRGISHELVRHRTLSPSQESTRYCNYSKDGFGGEITVIEPCFFIRDTDCYEIWRQSCLTSEKAYFHLLDMGCSPQQARDVLPNSLKTEVVMTGTHKEWWDFLKLRTASGVHPQMREVTDPLLADLSSRFPSFYGDIRRSE